MKQSYMNQGRSIPQGCHIHIIHVYTGMLGGVGESCYYSSQQKEDDKNKENNERGLKGLSPHLAIMKCGESSVNFELWVFKGINAKLLITILCLIECYEYYRYSSSPGAIRSFTTEFPQSFSNERYIPYIDPPRNLKILLRLWCTKLLQLPLKSSLTK